MSPVVRDVLPNAPLVAVEDFFPDQIRAQTNADTGANSSVLQTVDEEPVVPFQESQVRGGVTFLKQQAACPFRAFAELRLGTEPLAEPESGLSAAVQGTILHEVLQNFWDEMQSQKKLLESTEEQCRQMLHGYIRHALRRFFEHADEPWQRALLEIEADRVEDRLLAWLEVEKQRSEFTVLKTEDTLEHMHLGGVELRCRIDRIDRVEQGTVLMDYKTGGVNSNACDGERPDEPQLPAYAVLRQTSGTEEKPPAGIAFAGLHPKNVEFTVIGSLPGIFPDTPGRRNNKRANLSPVEMQRQQDEWRTTLTRLAEDFRTGAAVVDPKKRNETCRYCAQSLLCRIRETKEALEDPPEEENFGSIMDQHGSESLES